MLIERLTLAIPEMEMIQANTDGITSKIPRSKEALYREVCKQWEADTKLALEHVEFRKIVMRDVNNFLAIEKVSGKVKLKGAFEIDRLIHKNSSQNIVPIALKNYYVNDIPIDQTIRNHNDIFDFCKAVKSKKSPKKGQSFYMSKWFDKTSNTIKNRKLQKINRYYITQSKTGENLIKTWEDGSEAWVEAGGWKSRIFNQYYELDIFKDYEVDYKYYINECNKIIEKIENKTKAQLLSLF